ncbi:MAG: hypothetical protein K2X35_16060 [Bryobacteraceae bacterium]|nr:hypothetical protein [Bryobacteraceae bacterium]
MDHRVLIGNDRVRDEEPLALPYRATIPGPDGPETIDGCTDIVHVVAGYGGGKPMPLIPSKQELVLCGSIANHQHQMPMLRLHIKNLRKNSWLTSDVEELAAAIPADIDSDLRPLPLICLDHTQTRAHSGEVPTQILCRHTTPFRCGLG